MGKQVAPNVPKKDVPKIKAHFYVLRSRGEKPDVDDDECKSLHFLVILVSSKWGSMVSQCDRKS